MTTQATTNAIRNKIGQVAEVGGGYAEVVVEALGKDAKVPKNLWSQMVMVVFLWEGGCQELFNELKNAKIGLRMN